MTLKVLEAHFMTTERTFHSTLHARYRRPFFTRTLLSPTLLSRETPVKVTECYRFLSPSRLRSQEQNCWQSCLVQKVWRKVLTVRSLPQEEVRLLSAQVKNLYLILSVEGVSSSSRLTTGHPGQDASYKKPLMVPVGPLAFTLFLTFLAISLTPPPYFLRPHRWGWVPQCPSHTAHGWCTGLVEQTLKVVQ